MEPIASGGKTVGRRRKACQQCRSLKVRCSGQKPTCARCSRLLRTCTWASQSQIGQSSLHSSAVKLPHVSKSNTSGDGIGIPPTMLKELMTVYFSKFFYASLLLHQPSFEAGLASGYAKKHVVLSVCALAARINARRQTIQNDEMGQEWAKQAGKLLFAEVDDPSEENIVTSFNLVLFWFSLGHWQRIFVYESNATLTLRVLGLANGPRVREASLDAEMSRRRCWATFLVSQFVAQSSLSSRDVSEFDRLPLPCDDRDFLKGVIPTTFMTLQDNSRTPNIHSELIMIGSLWGSASALARDHKLDLEQKFSAIQKLDGKLRTWEKGLPTQFTLDNFDLHDGCPMNLHQRILISIVFHQSMCVLHSSIVPLFSLSSVAGEYGYPQIVSAQISLSHARQISSILRDFWKHGKIYWAGFVGYAAYSSSAIQMPLLWCPKRAVRDSALENIKTNSEVLESMGKQWKLVDGLKKYMPLLHRYHESMPYRLQDEPRMLDLPSLNQLKGAPIRARSSILSYNEIIWSHGRVQNQGSVDQLDLGSVADQNSLLEYSFTAPTLLDDSSEDQNNILSMSSLFDSGQTYDELPDYMFEETYTVAGVDWEDLNDIIRNKI